uniref:Zinc finger protein n=1 Tax=Parastrongyloides trichosuri TaxID=131310 RepID=A0A0N4ZQ84_PARTI
MDGIVFSDIMNHIALFGAQQLIDDPEERIRLHQATMRNIALWHNYNQYTSALMASQNIIPQTPLSLLTTPQAMLAQSGNTQNFFQRYGLRENDTPTTATTDTDETPKRGRSIEMISCDSCDKMFKTKKEQRQHSILHHERKFECERCTKTFLTSELLSMHVNKKHTPDNVKKSKNNDCHGKISKQFQCKICDRSYETYYNYKEHLAKHEGKTFQCNVCNKLLSGQSALSRHTKIHSKPHECIICKDRFSSAYDLDCHFSYYHSSVKRFRCQYCDRALYNYSGKLRHERLCAVNINERNSLLKDNNEEKENDD